MCLAMVDHEFSESDDLLAIREVVASLHSKDEHRCDMYTAGAGWGAHQLCKPQRPFTTSHSCFFISFGISTDWSFDTNVSSEYSCAGLALDPTVNLPVNLTEQVIFLKLGATSLTEVPFPTISVPRLRKWFGHDLYVLKMDCEGCEYSLAYDVAAEDPLFFRHVQQLNIELHLPKTFMSSDKHVYGLGRLFRMLHLAGLHLVHHDSGECSPADQAAGCHEMFLTTGFPCAPGCISLLFHKEHLLSISKS
jgi:hypothetical protein